MVTRRAECSCGQLSATCSGEPVRVSVCHCLACKRRTGSAFSFNARFPEDKVSIEGRSAEFTRIGDEGGRVTTISARTAAPQSITGSTRSPVWLPSRWAPSPILHSRSPSSHSITRAGAVSGSRSVPSL
jgi:hypothetical protein